MFAISQNPHSPSQKKSSFTFQPVASFAKSHFDKCSFDRESGKLLAPLPFSGKSEEGASIPFVTSLFSPKKTDSIFCPERRPSLTSNPPLSALGDAWDDMLSAIQSNPSITREGTELQESERGTEVQSDAIQALNKQALEKALSDLVGPCQLEFPQQRKETLGPKMVEIHREQISPTAFKITARAGDSEQSMSSICFEVAKLEIKSQQVTVGLLHMLADNMIVHMEKVVENLLQQSKMILYACIAAGVLGIMGGLLPIIGLMKGNAILQKLSKWFSSLRDAKQDKVFPSLSRAFDAASRTSEMGSRVNTTQSDGLKTRDEAMSKQFEIRHQEARSHYEEGSRRKDSYYSMIERLLEQWWQLVQSVCRG